MQLEDRSAATPRRAVLRGMMASALAATGALSPRTAFTQTSSIAPFTYHAPQSALDDLKQPVDIAGNRECSLILAHGSQFRVNGGCLPLPVDSLL